MPSNDAYSASIIVDGNALEEYEVEGKDAVLSCWIASEAGKNFSVRLTGAMSDVSLAWHIYIDGKWMKGCVYHASSGPLNQTSRGYPSDENTFQMFTFSQVSLTDDDSIASPDLDLSNLGTIEIRISRAEFTKDPNQSPLIPSTSNITTIHERSKKLAMHRVSLTETKQKRTGIIYKTRLLESNPHACFVFKYRPKDFLISQGIAPGLEDETESQEKTPSKSNSPGPKTKKRKRSEKADKENEEIEDARRRDALIKKEKQLQELQAEIELLKNGDGRVKQEIKTEPLATFIVDDNGVIDLTD
ncbi:hypothetical protein SCHPADRAFT_935288 [Schizopora paradoxa]|uniref:DUF7918 domain-containing protein n=1 Tax=Schizopora paradoxa TaxID=27342 RepID=A0A0H2S5L4_9AGAM|nr:hypothetical protein SCHPADRAFT_935288 [Schizopora paradoxa]